MYNLNRVTRRGNIILIDSEPFAEIKAPEVIEFNPDGAISYSLDIKVFGSFSDEGHPEKVKLLSRFLHNNERTDDETN